MSGRAGAAAILIALGMASACERQQEARPATARAGADAPDSAFDAEEAAMSITLTSPAFGPAGNIPAQYTCDGRNVSPPLAWRGLPEGTRSLVLIIDDPDAPDPRAPKRTWVHWVVYDIPATATSLTEGASREGLPPGAREGVNDWGRVGYGGPCPPIGRHRFFHKLFALDTVLTSLDRPNRKQLEQAMAGHVLGHGQLVGTYQRRGH